MKRPLVRGPGSSRQAGDSLLAGVPMPRMTSWVGRVFEEAVDAPVG